MILQGHQTPTPAHHPHNPDAPHGGGKDGGKGGRNQKPAHHKPTPAKPAHHKPAAHKQTLHKPSKPGRRTSGRGEVDIVWFDVEFKPMSKGGHLQ